MLLWRQVSHRQDANRMSSDKMAFRQDQRRAVAARIATTTAVWASKIRMNLWGFSSIQFARLSISATPVWISLWAQFLGGSLRTRSRPAGRDKLAHLLADRFDSAAALDESADAGKTSS